MKRILVVYYSLSGNAERVAADLAARLDADVERIRERRNRRGAIGYLTAAFDALRQRPALLVDIDRHAAEYELTIVGTPIWAGKMTPAVRSYLRTIRGRVNEIAFFTTSGSTDARAVVPAMEELAGRSAIAFAGFNERELRDPAAYDRKLSALVDAVRSRVPVAA